MVGQAIGNALCATGFAESVAGKYFNIWLFEKVLKDFEILGLISDEHSPWAERTIGAIVIVAITLINLGGWILRKFPNFHAQSNPWF